MQRATGGNAEANRNELPPLRCWPAFRQSTTCFPQLWGDNFLAPISFRLEAQLFTSL